MQIDLIYTENCPNVEATRTQLLNAFAEIGRLPRWREWQLGRPDLPDYVRDYGSPTILVNGVDAVGEAPLGSGPCCRVYATGTGQPGGVPSLADLSRALQGTGSPRESGGYTRCSLSGATLPLVAVAFLPKLFCPACWPAYAGLLGSLGIGFVNYTPFLLPSTLLFLLVALAGLGWRARRRRGFGPLLLGGVASGALLVGKFQLDSDTGLFVGLFLLIAASLWNTWPLPKPAGIRCQSCANESPE